MKGKLSTLLVIVMLATLTLHVWGAAPLPPPPPPQPVPVASFTVSPAAPVVNQSVQFADTSTGNPSAWAWIFGDGTSSTLRNPAHTYTTAGTFSVTLKAGNTRGSGTVTKSVVVKDGDKERTAVKDNGLWRWWTTRDRL